MKKEGHPPPHLCGKNFDENLSQKKMETQGSVEIVSELAGCCEEVFVKNIIMDDDTTTMAALKWQDQSNPSSKGKLDKMVVEYEPTK